MSDNVTREQALAADDPSRSTQLAPGAHGPVTVRVELMAQQDLGTYYHIKVDYPGQVGANVIYRGHRDDLVAAGCISAEVLASSRFDKFNRNDGHYLLVTSKAGPGKRGWIEVDYITARRGFAESLPGVRELFPEGLPRTGPPDRDGLIAWQLRRPRLRLVGRP